MLGSDSPTLGAAGPPQTRVGQDLLVLADGLVVAQALGATHAAGVKPVVRAHGDGHEAEGAESPRRSEQHHHASVTQPHVSFEVSKLSETAYLCRPKKTLRTSSANGAGHVRLRGPFPCEGRRGENQGRLSSVPARRRKNRTLGESKVRWENTATAASS